MHPMQAVRLDPAIRVAVSHANIRASEKSKNMRGRVRTIIGVAVGVGEVKPFDGHAADVRRGECVAHVSAGPRGGGGGRDGGTIALDACAGTERGGRADEVVPFENTSAPPPSGRLSAAAWIAAVSSVTPSPVAPKVRTFVMFSPALAIAAFEFIRV